MGHIKTHCKRSYILFKDKSIDETVLDNSVLPDGIIASSS